MMSSSRVWYRSRSKFEFPYLLSNGAEIWHRGQFCDADFEFEPKIRYNYVLKKKRPFFTKNGKGTIVAVLELKVGNTY